MPEKEIVKEMETFLQQACERLNSFEYESALRLFEQAIQDRPELPQIRYGKAIALARSGRVGEAVEQLRSLLAMQPDHQKARFLLEEIIYLYPKSFC